VNSRGFFQCSSIDPKIRLLSFISWILVTISLINVDVLFILLSTLMICKPCASQILFWYDLCLLTIYLYLSWLVYFIWIWNSFINLNLTPNGHVFFLDWIKRYFLTREHCPAGASICIAYVFSFCSMFHCPLSTLHEISRAIVAPGVFLCVNVCIFDTASLHFFLLRGLGPYTSQPHECVLLCWTVHS